MRDAHASDVADYYDSNTRRFLFMGSGAPSMHRALWGPGVASARDAAHYVDALVADRMASLGVGAAPRVLDFGCGVGGTLFHLAGAFPGARMTGVTVSREQVEVARRLAHERGVTDRCAFVQGDFHSVDLAKDADVVVAIESFAHSSSVEVILRNAARHLRPGGALLIVDDFLATDEAALTPRQRERVAEFRAGWRVPGIGTVSDLSAAAARCGLAVADDLDLTPLTRPGGRLRDRLTAVASPLLARLGLARMPFYGNMIGGNALQIGLREGFLHYRMLTLVRGPA